MQNKLKLKYGRCNNLQFILRWDIPTGVQITNACLFTYQSHTTSNLCKCILATTNVFWQQQMYSGNQSIDLGIYDSDTALQVTPIYGIVIIFMELSKAITNVTFL